MVLETIPFIFVVINQSKEWNTHLISRESEMYNLERM